MAYDPKNRIERMKELMKPIDIQIMMCDDTQDLFALASAMLVTSKQIFVSQIGKKGAREIFERVLKEI
jgi:hypothetical protein